jgi:hypothetical protein
MLDMLVKPPDAVVDYLIAITGLSAQSLAAITATKVDALTAFARALAEANVDIEAAVFVGHGLENDWLALGMGSLGALAAVIDTACIFSFANATATPSLGNLMSTLLPTVNFRAANLHHDSVSDAFAALRLVQQELGKPKLKHVPSPIYRVSIFIGNLDVAVSSGGLRAAFAPSGNVSSARVIITGAPRVSRSDLWNSLMRLARSRRKSP